MASKLNRWADIAESPASPEGLRQTAEAAEGYDEGGPAYEGSKLGRWALQDGASSQSRAWYTGANADGTKNGWDTAWARRKAADEAAAQKEGRLGSFFEDAEERGHSGIVTWDHESKDGRKFKFGDIYDQGQFVGNIYDQVGEDKPTADLLMTEVLDFDTQELKHLNNPEETAAAVEAKRQQNNIQIGKAEGAQQFRDRVEEREESLAEGGSQAAIIGGAAAGGATTGAGIGAAAGAVFGGVGALPGAAIGGLIGGGIGLVGGFLNQDELTETAARAYEVTSLAKEEHGIGAAIAEGAAQWGGVAQRDMSALSNVTRGLYDWRGNSANVGDMDADFYAVDKEGDREVPAWIKAVDVAASVGDGLLQFASPVGVTAFTVQMSSVIGGETAALGLTGGEMFSDERGEFKNIATDDEGNFDLGSLSAGIGKIGIDVAQLGLGRGLAASTNAARAEVGKESVYRTGGFGGLLRRNKWSDEGKAALEAGGRVAEVGGSRYILDVTGKAVDQQRNWVQFLVPSEQVAGLGARAIARRNAARPGAVSADDYYRAASEMARGERTMTTALINAMGEGYEEGLQSVLAPIATNDSFTAQEIIDGALYGAAMGGGMTLGTRLRGVGAEEKAFSRAKLGYHTATGGDELTREQWDAMDDVQKQTLQATSGMDLQTQTAAYKKASETWAHEINGGVPAANALLDAVNTEFASAQARLNNKVDQANVITQIEDATAGPSDAVMASAFQTAKNMTSRLKGIEDQQTFLQRELAAAEAELASDPQNPGRLEDLTLAQKRLADVRSMLDWGRRIDSIMDPVLDRIYAPDVTEASRAADVEALNTFLRDLFHERLDALDGQELTAEDKRNIAKAITQVTTRYPQDQAGSYQLLVPQISLKLTEAGAGGNNVVQISHAVLSALGADYDGDKVSSQNELLLDDAEFLNARSGAQFIGAGASVNIPAPTYEAYQIDYMSEALSSGNIALADFATGVLDRIRTAIKDRYAGVIPEATISDVMDKFSEQVHANNSSARAVLLDGLAEQAGGEITEFGRRGLENEWLWIDQLIRVELENFQFAYASHRPTGTPDTSTVAPNTQSTAYKTRRAERAATQGASMGLKLSGDSLFRMFQSLHYSLINASVEDAKDATSDETLRRWAQLYEAIGQNLPTTELERATNKDEITGLVYAQLEAMITGLKTVEADLLSRDERKLLDDISTPEGMLVLANMEVLDVTQNKDGSWSPGKKLSLAQVLLKRSIARDEQAKAAILETSEELRAKHRRLKEMTKPGGRGNSNHSAAEQAFVEIFGSYPLYQLLGEDANVFGPHLTLEQFVRKYVNMSESQRSKTKSDLMREAAYLGSKRTKDMPYDLEDAGTISAYRSLVDAVLAVGNDRISMTDAAGTLTGEFAKRSNNVSENFRGFITAVQQAVQDYTRFSAPPQGMLEFSPENIQRLFTDHPAFGQLVFKLIPPKIAPLVIMAKDDGNFYPANWFYEMFSMDAAEAEMHYWRNIMLGQWYALDGPTLATEDDGGDEEARGRSFDRLPRRMHRIMFKLLNESDGGLRYQEFFEQLMAAKDLNKFLAWINTNPSLRGNQAPIVAWFDDVADFDADKAGGGWRTNMAGADLRETISMLQQSTKNLSAEIAEERRAMKAERTTRDAIGRYAKAVRTGNFDDVKKGDKRLYEAFDAAIKQAGKTVTGLGPQAMVFQSAMATWGFYAQAHTKGKNPSHIRPQGSFEAQRDAFDYVTNYERMLQSLTTLNLDGVGQSLDMLARDGGRTMDDEGRVVEWAQPTVESMLAMFEKPQTRALARSILFPQVMERTPDGRLSTQLLVGKSLKDFLEADTISNLFAKDKPLRQDRAFTYIALLEAEARKPENGSGNFSVQRYVNDLLIARTSAATQPLSFEDIERLTTQAYYEVAQVLQAGGSIASQPGSAERLREIMAAAKTAQRVKMAGAKLGMEITNEEILDQAITGAIDSQQALINAKRTALLDDARVASEANDPARELEIQERIQALDSELTEFIRRIEALRGNNDVEIAVTMFSYDPESAGAAAKRDVIWDYILNHMEMMQRVPAAKEVLAKATAQTGQIRLTDEEWDVLSRGVISLYLETAISTSSPSVSVALWPDADHVQDQRYYDNTFGYLADILDPEKPLMKAAVQLHRRAGRQSVDPALPTEVLSLLDRTIFKEGSLGVWTGEIPRFSIDANTRLDSSAAEPGIAIPGNLPKRQAVESAAGRRTFLVPGEELLSRVNVRFKDLNQGLFDEIPVMLPGATEETKRPLAQLNNRFAKSVLVTFPFQEPIDIILEPNVGRRWYGTGDSNQVVANSGYFEIHNDRITFAIEAEARRRGLTARQLNQARVEIQFFHPDSLPQTEEGGPNWYNNIFFEGTLFKLDADQYESLNAGLFFSVGGANAGLQAEALGASKKGKPAIEVIETATSLERQAMEENWRTDLAAVLRAKTKAMIQKNLGLWNLEPEHYNAVYKALKMRHWVRRILPSGEVGLYSADQWIAMQQDNSFPEDEGYELWVPSDDVLRSMLGEQGTQGVPSLLNTELEIDLSKVPTFRGPTQTMIDTFAAGVKGETASIDRTRIANRARQSQLVVRPMLDEATRTAFEQKMIFRKALRDEIQNERSQINATQPGAFQPDKLIKQALDLVQTDLASENLTIDWREGGMSIVMDRSDTDNLLSKSLTRDLVAFLQDNNPNRMAWIFNEGGDSQPSQGVLSGVSLSGKQTAFGMRVAPDDLAIINLASFKGNLELAKKRIDYFTERGAIIYLMSGDASTDMRGDLASYLDEEVSYEKMLGSQHLWQPADLSQQFQNQRARVSTLVAVDTVSTKNRLGVFYAKGLPVQEGAAWVDNDNPNLRNIATQMNLVQTDAYGDYNVPITLQQISDVKAQLRGMDNPDDREFLREMATASIRDDDPVKLAEKRQVAGAKFDEAFDRMLRTFDSQDGSVLPGEGEEFGTGDIIPLLNSQGQILLYRHGMKAPRNVEQIAEMQEAIRPGDLYAANIATYSSVPEENSTDHRGTVVEFSPRASYGLQVELSIDLQTLGDKQQFEWNGTKFVFTPRPDSIVLPDHGFFRNWGIDIITGVDTPVGKEGLEDIVDNHRNAFAFLGINFEDDMAKFFFPSFDSATAEQKQEYRTISREVLKTISRQAPKISVETAYNLQNATNVGSSYSEMLLEVTSAVPDLNMDRGWVQRLNDDNVESQIAWAMITYLMTPGAEVSHVLQSGGFNDQTATTKSFTLRMPSLFTRVFDNAAPDSKLRTEMFRRFNQQLYNPNSDGTGYVLKQNWDFEIINADRSKNMVGWLQFPEVHSSGDNPIKNGMTYDTAELQRQAYSQHAAATSYLAMGARTATAYELAKVRNFARATGLMRFDGDEQDGGLWRMMTRVRPNDKSFRRWQLDSPAEAARRELARSAFLEFRKEIDKTPDAGWSADGKDRARYEKIALDITNHLNLRPTQIGIVDGWIRQQLGMPWGPEGEGNISARAAIQMAEWIRKDVYGGYLPTIAAEVPLIDVSDLQLIYRANAGRADGWKPRGSLDASSTPATSWNSWVEIALGSAFMTDNLFDPLYLLATDGFMHTYQNATESLLSLPVSLSADVANVLMDPETSRLLVSISPDVRQLTADPMILNVQKATIEELISGQRIASPSEGRYAPADVRQEKLNKRRKWRAENDTPVPVDITMKNFRKNGADFINHSTNTIALSRILVNLRVGSALLNPALWVSMGPEQFIRSVIDTTANLATGQSSGRLGALQAETAQWLSGTPFAEVFERLGLTTAYSTDQIKKLMGDPANGMVGLYGELGNRSDFKSMIYKELNFKRPGAHAPGRGERWSGAYARWGLGMQDATYGVPAKSLAKRYFEAAAEAIRTRTGDLVSTDTLIAAMRTNPRYLEANYPEAHKAGVAAVAQLRSLKPTPLSLALRNIYEPLSEHSNGLVNFASNLFLKIPLLFTNYSMNVLITLTGLQGFSDAWAMWLHGNEKNALVQRAQAWMTGKPVNPYYDMSEVLEGMDLSRSFIRGGLTHTGLFAMGLMAGGLGLTGEDDEERRRRRAAYLQGGLTTKDPRKVRKDFRDADAIWFGATPFQMPWIAKQFLSPVMGMERFFDTGDFRQVWWGFADALGSFPLINSLGVMDAYTSAQEFAAMARAEAEKEDSESQMQSVGWLVSAVGVYERMLFENSFINQVYQSWDRYDRDPFAQPLLDSGKTIQGDATGTTRGTDKTETFRDEETGEIKQGTINRDFDDAYLHSLTENRFTLAAGLAIFTGKFTESDYIRTNMAPKKHKLEKDLVTEDQATEAVINAMIEQGGLEGMTKEEATAVLSLVDKDGREHLTLEGAEAVVRGQAKGMLLADSPALKGIYITYEMREAIQAKLMEEIVQEGVDNGMSQQQATTRMKRLWFGPLEDPSVQGIGDILWSKEISYSDTLEYYQLNTTYVIGPDGKPWATGYERNGVFGALGLTLPFPLAWQKQIEPRTSALGIDERGNTTDLVADRNTGMRALDLVPEIVPTDEEIGQSIVDAIEELGKKIIQPNTGFGRGGGFGGYGGYSRGGGGGGGYGGSANFYEMRAINGARSGYGNNIPFINTSNPYIRRAMVRRERISGERGRLFQWQ